MVWAHKRRGFRTQQQYNPEDVDLHSTLGMRSVNKHHIVSVTTSYQRIDIFDLETNRFVPYYNANDDVETTNPQVVHPQLDRVVYLDSILQSRRFGDAAYHETLVHPALLTHPHPRRVVIIGGGEGATLREVLKHATVEKVIMVEIDPTMVQVSREYLPEWSDCSEFTEFASCMDDPRATVYYEDAIQWFIDRYGGDDNKNMSTEDRVDVIVMDAL